MASVFNEDDDVSADVHTTPMIIEFQTLVHHFFLLLCRVNLKRCLQKQRWGWKILAGIYSADTYVILYNPSLWYSLSKNSAMPYLYGLQCVIQLYSWPKHVACFFTAFEVNNQWLVFLGRPPHLQDPILSTRASRASPIIKNFGRGSWRPMERNCKGLPWMKSPIDKFVLFQTRQVWFMVWYGLFVVACYFRLFCFF